MQKKKVLALNIEVGSFENVLEAIVVLARKREPSFVCFVNAHMSIEAQQDENLGKLINQADILTADGVPVAKSIKLLYGIAQDRMSGMDSFPTLLSRAEKENLSVFLFGSTDEVLTQIEQRIRTDYPNLDFKGYFSPPFGEPINNPNYVDIINQSGASMVFVALGCPKQERWMAENYQGVNALLLGVGGAFPVFAGVQSRAPKWMQKYSLEWFYRLTQEPKRLWKRYFYTNSLFLWFITKQWLSERKSQS